jgi:hypothetical protein
MPTKDTPEQSYYPSCRVRFIIRLEDYGAKGTPEPPAKPSTARSGKKDKTPAKLRVVDQGASGLLLLGPGDDPQSVGSPQDQRGSADQFTHVIDGIIPIQAQFLRNGIRTADTASIEVAYADLPIDPRVVRSCAVQLFMGTVSPDDYSRGMLGELRTTSSTGSGVRVPYNVLPDEYTDSAGRPRTNLRFEGWVDEWQADWPDSDSPTVSLECTDNTRLLLDQDAPAQLTVSPTDPIDQAFADYLSNFPQFRGLSVTYRPNVERGAIPVLKKSLASTKFQPKLGPAPSGGGTGGKLKVWDYLTDVAGSIGHTLRFEGTLVIIQRARTLYDSRLSARGDDPYTGRVLPSGLSLVRRLYVYGRNIREMKMGRKFATIPNMNVEVRSYDTAHKKTLVARFPLKEDRVKDLKPGNSAEQKWIVKTVAGIKDEPTLRIIAQGIYEQVTRNELVARVITKNLGSYGGGNADPDSLDIKAGDALDVRVLREGDVGNTVQEAFQAVATRASDFLTTLGYSERFARAYQQAADHIGMPATFRCKTMGGQWESQSEGITLDFEMTNYIEIRADKLLPSGEEISAASANAGSPVQVKVEDNVGT